MKSVGECSQAKRPKIEEPTIRLSLPEFILHGILSHVANHSLYDIASAELVSKRFREIVNGGFVRNNLSLREVTLFPLPHEMYYKRFFKFMKLCRKNDNHEAIFRKGLINFFHMTSHHQQQKKGQDQMEKAGNELAKFKLGLILLCQGGENIDKGLDILSPLLTEDSLSTLRQKFQGFRQEIENAWSWWGRPNGNLLKSTYSKRECNCNGRSRIQHWAWSNNGSDRDVHVMDACPICVWYDEYY